MTCLSGLTGWAGRILESLGETGIPTGQVVTWLKNNFGNLNVALETSYEMSGSCVSPDMNQAASGIYTEMYYCHYYQRKASQNLGALAYDSWVEIEGEDQGRIRRVSRNEIAKTYLALAKECKENLKQLIKWYKDHSNAYSPLQVVYNSRGDVADSGLRHPGELYPPDSLYSHFNVIWDE